MIHDQVFFYICNDIYHNSIKYTYMLIHLIHYYSKEEGKDQESIQYHT